MNPRNTPDSTDDFANSTRLRKPQLSRSDPSTMAMILALRFVGSIRHLLVSAARWAWGLLEPAATEPLVIDYDITNVEISDARCYLIASITRSSTLFIPKTDGAASTTSSETPKVEIGKPFSGHFARRRRALPMYSLAGSHVKKEKESGPWRHTEDISCEVEQQ